MANRRPIKMLGIGIDAVDVDRFRKLLERRPHLRQRLFTTAELTSLEGRTDDAASLAARFAVREATMRPSVLGLELLTSTMSRLRKSHRGRLTYLCQEELRLSLMLMVSLHGMSPLPIQTQQQWQLSPRSRYCVGV